MSNHHHVALVYVATNPVAAGLLERAEEWPGVTGWPALDVIDGAGR